MTSMSDVELEAENVISSPPPSHSNPPKRTARALGKLFESESSSEDEAPVQVSRNKMVARLNPQLAESSSETENDEDDAGAYERVRKMLMSGTTQPGQETKVASPTKTASINNNDEDDNDDDDVPVRAHAFRRLATKAQRKTLPRASSSPAPASRRSSPGLFVTPVGSPIASRVSKPPSDGESDSDVPPRPDFQTRVARIRAERMARQEAEQQRKPQTSKSSERHSVKDAQESDSDPDGETGRRLTQQSRPTRKAGKKALEEMHREQQRISRNMQLTHQAKTKKKYGVKDLLTRFGFPQDVPEVAQAPPTPDASSILASSDAEGNHAQVTPPTSPPAQEDPLGKNASSELETPAHMDNGVMARDVDAAAGGISEVPVPLNKGKGRASDFQHVPLNPLIAQSQPVIVQSARVKPSQPAPKPASIGMVELSDSEDEVEVQKPKSRFPVFDHLPEKKKHEASSLLNLRHLAHLTSPSKRAPKSRNSVHPAELQISLIRKARQQAQKEREEKIEELKRRGIHIETQEEREKHQLEIEDMVALLEKARQEDLKLRKVEKDEAKKNGEIGDGLSSDESEDEDYVASGEEDLANEDEVAEEADIELSGSEDEDVDEVEANEEGEPEEDDASEPNFGGFLDQEAVDEEEDDPPQDMELDKAYVDQNALPAPARKRTNRPRNIVLDEEDESGNETLPTSRPSQSTQSIGEAEDDDMAAFGFSNRNESLGLTQMFAGTMANLQSQPDNAATQEQDSMDIFRSLPDSHSQGLFGATPEMLVPNSQTVESQQMEQSQAGQVSPMRLGISQLIQTSPGFSHTQFSEVFEPTQDAGFELSRSPAGLAPPQSTIDTVMLGSLAESPVMKRKGRLQRRKIAELSDDGDGAAPTVKPVAPVEHGNAFDAMRKTTKERQADEFNKKTSWAKEIALEQAEESEDEYAGLGGASDDDSGEDDEELEKMLDESDIKVNERKIAALFAENSKADDEKNINQLYKDIMNGGLRKRRGGDLFEMSDSEDEAEQRRRRKQAEFQKMRKALMADENIGKIAQNPKQSAFFRTLEDHDDDPDYDFLNAPDADIDTEDASQPNSNDESQANKKQDNDADVAIPDSQTEGLMPPPAPANPLKRKSIDSQDKENRPPPHLRRTAAADSIARKPITLQDVQHSVSELLEDPHFVPESQYSEHSDSEDEPASARPAARKPIIDRLTLSRESSSSSLNSMAGNMAFHAASAGAYQPGFKVPSLIRRATSNLSATTTTSGASTPTESAIRRGGTGRSNIHAQAREAERKARLEAVEKKRRDGIKKKVGKARGKGGLLGMLDSGFE